jgi:predicted nicotinamide N-methyase
VATPKQFERFAIQRMTASHPEMRKLRRDGHVASIHGNKHWPAADLLMDYFQRHPLPKRKRVIDAGCGWGLGGTYCARTFKSTVLAVDADPAVFPYLQAHAELNAVDIEPHIGKFQSVKGKLLNDVYAVIGADICFWDEMVKPLHGLIKRSLAAGAKRVAIADPGRSPFYKLAEKCAKKYGGELLEWQSEDYPELDGFILEIRNK